ncbi:MAG: (Fe-S)-binding protein [Hyphomicrobiaceae bacterium]
MTATTIQRQQTAAGSGAATAAPGIGTRAEAAVDKFLQVTDSAIASYLEACVHCGECSEACHFYLSTHDPRYTPIYKLQPLVKAYKRHKAPLSTVTRALGLAPAETTFDELQAWSELVYDSCNMCGRCTLVCPMGIDIAGSVRKMREGFVAADLAPEGLRTSEANALRTGSPMNITPKALRAQIAGQERETGIPIALDKKGADYMVILSAMEVMGYPEVIGALSRIFAKAGVDWTISTKAFEATNVGVQIGSRETARTLVSRVVEAAEELGVRYVISPECGHAYGALRWEGPNLMGRGYKFEVVHILELLDQLRREGRLKFRDKDKRRVTLHDPCQIVRRGGLVAEPRALMNEASEGFVEMRDSGVTNLCCGGGGGVSANPRAHGMMTKAFACKLGQFNEIDGLELVVSPCANCRTTLEEGLENYEVNLPVIGLGEFLAEHLAD